MDAEKETDSNKSAPSHCKTEREEPSIKNAAEAASFSTSIDSMSVRLSVASELMFSPNE